MACNNGDFLNTDFDNQDFLVSTWFGRFKRFFRELLPMYFIQEDTYKNVNGEGLYERYMMLFGEYIDEDIIPEINCYLNIIDASVADEKYLNHISDVLGNPPDVFNDINQYRNLLTYIVSIYKIKGTKRAYALFFSILGFDIEINEIEPESFEGRYDTTRIYDEGEISIYDRSACQHCSSYEIKFSYKDTSITVFDSSILNKLLAAIEFNEPINAILEALTLVIYLEDEMSISISDESEHNLIEMPLYDVGHFYDDELDHDFITTIDPEAMISHIRWESTTIDEELVLQADIYDNLLPGFNFDLDTSYIRVVAKDVDGNTIWQQLGSFINPIISSGYINTLALSNEILLPEGTEYLQLVGRIYLDNNTFYSFNETLSLNQTKFTNIYFNNF